MSLAAQLDPILTSTHKVNQYHRWEAKAQRLSRVMIIRATEDVALGQVKTALPPPEDWVCTVHRGHGSGPSEDGTPTTRGLGVHGVTKGIRDLCGHLF